MKIMPVSFRIYCSANSDEDADAHTEVEQVSVFFSSAREIEKLANFLLECAAQAAADEDWEHEHYFGNEPHPQNISIGLLLEENL